jgi:hypothetical protein
MKLFNRILLLLILFFIFVIVPLTATGAIWVYDIGLLPGTSVVFASDSGDLDRFMARTLKLVYGDRIGICDGANDEVELLAANNAVGAGTAQLLDGNYNIQDDLTLTTLFRGLSSEATNLNITDGVAFKLNYSGNLQDLRINKPTGSGIALEIEVASNGTNYFNILKFLDGVRITNTAGDVTGTGLYLHTTATTINKGISFCQFGSIWIGGFEYGLKMYADCSDTNSWISGNNFESLLLYNNKYDIYASTNSTGTGTPTIASNTLQAIQIQPTANTVNGIELADSNVDNWKILSVNAFDWFLASGKALKIASGSTGNIIIGSLRNSIADNGSNNLIIDTDSNIQIWKPSR